MSSYVPVLINIIMMMMMIIIRMISTSSTVNMRMDITIITGTPICGIVTVWQ